MPFHGTGLTACIYLALATQYPIIVNGQLGDGLINLTGPSVHLGLTVNMIPLLNNILDMPCPYYGYTMRRTTQMGLDMPWAYAILTFLAYQHTELGINAKYLVGMVFTGHLERIIYIYWVMMCIWGFIANTMYLDRVEI
jgi:hypothetical protein